MLTIAAKIFRAKENELNPDSKYGDVVGWDSLAHLEFIVALEKHFKLKLSARDVMSMESLADATSLIEKNL